MFLRKITLALSMLLFTLSSHAALVDYQEKDDVVYFLYSSPNKIARYDLASSVFLDEVTLDDAPTAFEIKGNNIFIGFQRELRKLAIDGTSNDFIRNTGSNIDNITALKDNIFVELQDSNVLSVNTNNSGLNETRDSWYSGQAFIASEIQNSYYYRTTGVSPSDIHKVTINEDGTTLMDRDSPYHGDFPNATRLYLNESENKIYDDAGIIYFASDLSYIGTLAGTVDALAFLGDNAIAARENTLQIFSPLHVEKGTIELSHSPFLLANYEASIVSFAEVDGALEVLSSDLSGFNLPQVGDPVDPNNINFQPELFATDNVDTLFMMDIESLSIFRWSATTNNYLTSWSIINPANWMNYSATHERLYVGYSNGKITYFDTSDSSNGLETDFTTLANPINGLLSVDDYLVAIGSTGTWHSFNKEGVSINAKTWRTSSSEYLLSSSNNHIIYYGSYLEWAEISTSSGELSDDRFRPYNTNIIKKYPLRLNETDELILNGAGQIINADDFTLNNTLSNNISDAIWVDNNLITIKAGEPFIQFWASNYELLSEQAIPGADSARLFNMGDQFLISRVTATRPVISIYEAGNITDSDNDGAHDLEDNCVNDANASQDDYDTDGLGDACDSDDDNDGLPDTIEIELGLSDKDASDAEGDLDGDSFSNRVEFLLNSDPNDSESLPVALTEFFEGFEQGWPLGFYTPSGSLPWSISSIKYQGNYSLKSATIPSIDSVSDISFSAYFSNGVINFNYLSLSEGYRYHYYDLEIYVDGVRQYSRSGSSSEQWSSASISISEGQHAISFRATSDRIFTDGGAVNFYIDNLVFAVDTDGDGISDPLDNCPNNSNSYQQDYDNDGIGDSCDNAPYGQDADNDGWGDSRDNCPDIANPLQENIDNDAYGDACDDSDDRPVDTDLDGIGDEWDNCPNTMNADQIDMDYDGRGNACDDDIDGDGILNTVENQYEFLNPEFSGDALLDQDNDGASNAYEIQNGTSVNNFEQHDTINLLEYFPLGNGEQLYLGESSYTSRTMTGTNNNDQYIVTFNNGKIWYIEAKADGIYLTKIEYTHGDYVIFDGFLIMPKSMIAGDTIEFEYSYNYFDDNDNSYGQSSETTSLYLKSTSEQVFNGNLYPAITLEGNWGNETTYLKGVGQYNMQDMILNSSTLGSGDYSIKAEDDDSDDDLIEGLGGISNHSLWALSLLVLFRRKANK